MDLQMPVMDGTTAMRHILQSCRETNKKAPEIIAVTASALAGDHEQALEAGFSD